MDKKEKINFDLDFLGKGAPEANQNDHAQQEAKTEKVYTPKPSRPMSDNTKKWLTGIVIVGGLIIWGAFTDGSDTSTPSTTNSTVTASQDDNDLIQTGQYKCARYHHDKAGELEPATSEGIILDTKTTQLTDEGDRLDIEAYEIENEYVDEYSQRSINQHDERIDDYNIRLKGYQTRVRIHKSDIDNYNSKVSIYNKYLIANCTRAY